MNRIKIIIPLLAVAMAWLGMAAGEWAFRFLWYNWHNRVLVMEAGASSGNGAVSFRGQGVPLSTIHRDARPGGNLSHLIPFESAARLYAEPRPEYVIQYDEFGFLNNPPVADTYFPVVVVGDSFTTEQTSASNSFPAALSIQLDEPVYNYGFAGYGATFSFERFYKDPRFQKQQPKCVVWALYSQHLIGTRYWPDLKRMLAGESEVTKQKPRRTGGGVNWPLLHPRRLGPELSSTSIFAQQARNVNEVLRYYLFDQLPADLVPRKDLGILFCQWSVDDMAVEWDKRNPDIILGAIEGVRNKLSERGISLIIALIPDKEHVHSHVWQSNREIASAVQNADYVFSRFESAVNNLEVPMINLLPIYREAVQEGRPMYWRDDTHWRPEGALLAANLVARKIREAKLINKSGSNHDL